MKTRSQEEIDNLISLFRRLRNKMPEYNYFGDNNWKVIDTQIDILNGEINDEDEVYDIEESLGEMGLSNALEVFQWLDGEIESDNLISESDLE